MPSTGQCDPYVHLFFGMPDGSAVAFFDLGDNQAADLSPNSPSWCNHMALHMNSVDEVLQAKSRLEAHGVHVIGPTDHKFVQSIYFFDPNGYRLELTHELADEEADYIARAGRAPAPSSTPGPTRSGPRQPKDYCRAEHGPSDRQ